MGYYWFWYADECGDPQHFIAMSECVTIVVQETFTLWVRNEGPLETGHCTGLTILVDDYPDPLAVAPSYVCQGDSVTLSGSGGVAQSWNGPGGFAAFTAQAIASSIGLAGPSPYVLTTYSLHGCTANDTAMVDVITVPELPMQATDATCHGGSDGAIMVDSLAAMPYAIIWSPGGGTGPSLTGLAAGEYLASITDSLGCMRTDTIMVLEPDHPLDTVLVSTATCGLANGAVSVVLHPGASEFTFTWTPEAGTGAAIGGLAAGAYSVVLANALGCTYTASAFVGDTGTIAVSASPTVIEILFGDSTELMASFVPYDPQASITWSPADGLACASCLLTVAAPQADAVYTVTITNSLGCSASDSAQVIVLPRPEPAFFLPTHFSPNADGRNDEFAPLGGIYARMRLVITDDAGHAVFIGDGERPAWDGTAKGAPARAGVYTVHVECERRDGTMDVHRAQLTLMR